MKTRWMLVFMLVAMIAVTGCKKSEPKAPAEGDTTTAEEAPGVVETVKETASQMAAEFTKNVDLEKTVEDLKAEAAKMSVDDLRAVAVKYKEAIEKKKVDINAVTEKLKAIPVTEKLGTEAQDLTKELKTLSESLKPLTERLSVYVDAIAEKGGNVSDLKAG